VPRVPLTRMRAIPVSSSAKIFWGTTWKSPRVVDYGTFDDLSTRSARGLRRSSQVAGRPGTKFLLWCLEWQLRTWERLTSAILPFGNIALQPGEVERWFTSSFDIKQVAGETGLKTWPRGWAAYLMTYR
jgi:hypothetical protein